MVVSAEEDLCKLTRSGYIHKPAASPGLTSTHNHRQNNQSSIATEHSQKSMGGHSTHRSYCMSYSIQHPWIPRRVKFASDRID